MAGRTREENPAELEDWRVDGLPGERPGDKGKREKDASPAPSRKPRPSKAKAAASEWLPWKGRKRRRAASGNGNGRAGVDELERRANELERELQSERRRAREEIAKLRSQLREQGGEREAKASSGGRLDANAASFEQLRGLGLTAAQSAKLIARREDNGGFKAKADLRRIPGLSKSAREVVEKRLSVRR